MVCSKCKQAGHNARTCLNPVRRGGDSDGGSNNGNANGNGVEHEPDGNWLRDEKQWFSHPSWGCAWCGQAELPASGVDAHLSACVFSPTPTDFPVLHFEAQAFQGVYGFSVVCDARATFGDLDRMLREVWMEPCCGHLSTFYVAKDPEPLEVPLENDLLSTSFVDLQAEPDGEGQPFSTPLSQACQVEDTILLYQYDYGSTTCALVRFCGTRHLAQQLQQPMRLVARNAAPCIPCCVCRAPARFVQDTDCGMDFAEPQMFYCSQRCAPEKVEWGLMSELRNSPRSGACGYPVE